MHRLEEKKVRPRKYDQVVLRRVAARSVKVLPVEFANTKTMNLVPKEKMKGFHAICTQADKRISSVEKKLMMLTPFLTGVSHTS